MTSPSRGREGGNSFRHGAVVSSKRPTDCRGYDQFSTGVNPQSCITNVGERGLSSPKCFPLIIVNDKEAATGDREADTMPVDRRHLSSMAPSDDVIASLT